MTTLKVHFDGHVLVPEEPVDLPLHRTLEIQIVEDAAPPNGAAPNGEAAEVAAPSAKSPLAALADWAETLPDNPDSPTDAAAQHDHYLYGTPKRP